MEKTKSLYHGHRFPATVTSHAGRWYFRFQLSLRDIEEPLFERGVIVSYETIRRWRDKFRAGFAHRVKAGFVVQPVLSEGFFRQRLVHNYQVECHGAGSQVLGDGLRPHHKTWLQRLDRPAGAGKDFSDGHARPLLGHQKVQQDHFGPFIDPCTIPAGGEPGVLVRGCRDGFSPNVDDFAVQALELLTHLVVL